MKLKVYVYGKDSEPIVFRARKLLKEKGITEVTELKEADVAVAPLLKVFLTREMIDTPKYGTLIFHPSMLPRHRGRDAIRWAIETGEKYTGATWFWCSDGVDDGPICEQEVLEIEPGISASAFYVKYVMPSCLKMLGWALDDLEQGYRRSRVQVEEYATLEPHIEGDTLPVLPNKWDHTPVKKEYKFSDAQIEAAVKQAVSEVYLKTVDELTDATAYADMGVTSIKATLVAFTISNILGVDEDNQVTLQTLLDDFTVGDSIKTVIKKYK